ncbi:hypothetical protein FQR65_LT08099 [Abscondita terminalis]|nr:hypothetical protein FQR65_LT08099 [Abscondita terminalis]
MDMSQNHAFWEENANVQHVKFEGSNSNDEQQQLKDERNMYPCCDGNFNFSTALCSEDESEYNNGVYKKNKVSRQDPMSHRIIEKRRRDRMNNCLADLSRLIPTEYLKKGRGRIEKTEIIEMAIKYMKHLQHLHISTSEHYRLGYQECMSEAMRFLVEVEGHFPREAICIRLLTHLQKHCETLSRTTQSSLKENLMNDNYSVPVKKISEEKLKIPEQIDLTATNEANDINNVTNVIDDRLSAKPEPEDKHLDNLANYKYKNDIKLRFSQDLTSAAKKQKVDNGSTRRISIASIENHSSSYGSPPSSNGEFSVPTLSENEAPRENNSIMRNYHFKNDSSVPIRPILNGSQLHSDKYKIEIKNFNIPIFVFHAKGSFYIPLTIDYFTLMPFLQNYNLLESFSNVHDLILHPVSINVSFHPNCATVKYKSDFSPNWH